jgi:hypothetical protein
LTIAAKIRRGQSFKKAVFRGCTKNLTEGGWSKRSFQLRHAEVRPFLFVVMKSRFKEQFWCKIKVVRIYDVARRSWLDVAMMKPDIWQALDGDTTPCELDEVVQLVPMPLLILARDEALVVIFYEDWKQRVMRLQSQKKEA